MKNLIVLVLLFLGSAVASLMALPLAAASVIAGAVMVALAIFRPKPALVGGQNAAPSRLLLISGIALLVGPILTVAVVVAGMAGAFSVFR